MSTLREELAARYKHLIHTFAHQTKDLADSPTWKELPDSEAADILARNKLVEPKTPELGTEDDVLKALERSSLEDLENRADAIPSLVSKARQDAATFLEPKAVPLQLPKTTLKTPEEAEAYLDELRTTILDYLADGRPVVI